MQLVQMGCEVNTLTSRFNQTPTHTAAFGGHPHCVLWLTQAGADVNRQDFVGEAPIHKAARSGSLECIQVLLIAGAKPHLRNASGQTAADLAHTHGFHDCFSYISKTQKHLLQLNGLHVNGVQNGNSALCGQDLTSRKRLLTGVDTGHMKKARRADKEDVLMQMQSSEGEELESMNVELNSDFTKATTNGLHHSLPCADPEPPKGLSSPSSPPASQQAAAPAQRSFADMCGSLHLTGSPSSCVSHRPAWWGPMGADYGDFLHYGHYHGFGDTAEELSDSSCLDCSSSIQAEHRYKPAVASTIHLYHGS
ncbi:ankyrin repeat domain-containing protein 10-like isoform X2 [Chelmon rostratus]|nr:ankyrin repeat domain-containing protein 10-like isoform X2 [Chelmon rostratus]